MMDVTRLLLWELYELLQQAGRLTYKPEADRWLLDGAELPQGTDYARCSGGLCGR